MAMVFFVTALFSPTKTFAEKKKDQKKATAKTEQVKAVKTETQKPVEKAAVKPDEKKKDQNKGTAKTEQVKAVKTEAPKPVEKAAVKPNEKPAVKTDKITTTKPAAIPSSNSKELTKKDGTPDKRYKQNKETAKPVGPLKKDGTPDMRYKQNKEAAKTVGPLKKDGTPDLRYKANKKK